MASLPGIQAAELLIPKGWLTTLPPGVKMTDDDWCGDAWLIDPQTGAAHPYGEALLIQAAREDGSKTVTDF
jgi:hypothetical protein